MTSNQKINTFLTYLIRKTAETSNPISSMQLQNYIGHILRWIDLGVDVILYLSGKVYLPKAKYFFRSQSVIPVAFWSLIRKFGPDLPKPSFIGKFPGHELDRFLENRQFYSFWAWHRQISGNLIQKFWTETEPKRIHPIYDSPILYKNCHYGNDPLQDTCKNHIKDEFVKTKEFILIIRRWSHLNQVLAISKTRCIVDLIQTKI